MPASIKTVLQLDDTPLKAKLDQVKKYYNQTYNDWANATEKVTIKDKELAQQKEKLAIATANLAKEKQNSNNLDKQVVSNIEKEIAGRKSKIKVLTEEKRALAASASQQKAELSMVGYGESILKKKLDTTNQTISATKDNTTATKNQTKSTESLANATIRYLRWAGTIAGVVYATKRAWDATLGIGLEVNKMMEDNTSGIAALLSANTQMVLSNGQVVNSYEKFKIGQGVASDAMEDLRKASVKTYATFPQLTEIFQQAIGQTLSMGDSFGTTTESIISNTVKLSQRMSNIAGAIGMPMDRVREEIRSLLSGNASTDSLISTMIFGSPTEANKAIRDAKTRGANGVKDLLDTMLTPFDALEGVQSFTRSLLELQDAWSQTMAKISTPVFEDLKVVFKDLAKDINENQQEIQDGFNKTYEIIKEVTPALGRITVGVGAIRLAAMVNPFTAWTVAIVSAIQALDDMASRLSGERFTKGITSSITSQSGSLQLGSSTSDVEKQLKTYEAQITARANILASADKESELYRRSLEAVTSINNEMIRLQGLTDGTAEKQDKLTKNTQAWAELLTKVPIDSEFFAEVLKENNKSQEETLKLQEKINTANEKVIQLGKAYNTIQQEGEAGDKIRAKLQADALATQTYIADREKEINEIRAKESEKIANAKREYNKLLQDQWVAEQKLAGIEVKKSDILLFELEAISKQIQAEKDKNKLIDLNTKAMETAFSYNQSITQEEEQQSANRKKAFDEIAKNVAQQQKWNEERDEREQKAFNDKIKKQLKLFDLQSKGTIRTAQGDDAFISPDEYEVAYSEIYDKYVALQESMSEVDEVTKEKLKDSWNKALDDLDSAFEQKTFEIDIKLNGFDDVSNSIASIVNGLVDIGNANAKLDTQNAKTRKAEFKYWDAFGDFNATQEDVIDAEDDWSKEKEKSNKMSMKNISNQIGGYADMTGAIASFYDEDDDRREKQQKLAEVLHIAKMAFQVAEMVQSGAFTTMFIGQEIAKAQAAGATAVAIAAQSSPWTGFATAAAMIALLGSIGIMLSGSGGGGGVPISSTGKTYEANRQDIESEYTPITDRLDRQTEILESIDRNGSASKIGVANASATFERDIRLWIEDVLEGSLRTGQFRTLEVYAASEQVNRDFLEGLTTAGGTTMTLNESILRYGNNLINTISELSTNYDKFLGNLLYWDDRLEAGGWWDSDTVESAVVAGAIQDISEYQDILSEWTLGIIDSMSELKEASEDFKDSYDAITGSMYYENKRLVDAFSDIDKIIGSRTLDQYLKENIEGIETLDVALMGSIDSLFGERLPASLEKYVDANATVFDTLLSQNIADIEAQTTILAELSMQTGIIFEGGAEEALNYIESIELVAEAMATSRENIKSFTDSFLDDEQLLTNMATELGVNVATTESELMALFETLKLGMDGLNDSELALLEANKALIESNAEVADSTITLADIWLNASEKLKSLQDSKIDLSKIDPKIYTNDAGAFNAEISKLEAKKAVDIISYASENALMISDAMGAFSSAFVSLPQNSIYNPANQQTYQNYAYALRDAVDGGNDIIGITNELNHMLATRDMRDAYTSTAQGIASIKAASEALADVSSMGMFNGKIYFGDAAIAYQKTLGALDGSLSKGIITLEVYDKTLNYINNNYSDLIDSGLTYQEALEKQQAAILAGQWNVYYKSLDSINYYFGEIGKMSDVLVSTAEEIAKPVNQITNAIGRLNSTTQVFEYSVSSLTNMMNALGLKETPKEAYTATLIAESADILANSLTTANAKAITEELAKNPAFADTMPDQLKQFAFMIEGVTAYNYQEIERAFMLMNDSLIDGNMTQEQYTALFNTSLDLYEDSFKTQEAQLATLKQIEDTVKSIDNYQRDLILGAGTSSLGVTQRYSGFKGELNSLTSSMMAETDISKFNALFDDYKSVSGSFLDLAKSMAGDNETYARDFTFVYSALGDLENKAKSLENAIITPNLLRLDGSHATGLDYVPFDGYVAELHKGERVQTAKESNDMSKEIAELKNVMISMSAEIVRMRQDNQRLNETGTAMNVRVVS